MEGGRTPQEATYQGCSSRIAAVVCSVLLLTSLLSLCKRHPSANMTTGSGTLGGGWSFWKTNLC